ncbi:MAG: serine hydrolase [Chitinophagaceae bacterium]|nr:serine hydrolase [Chitinophagaceae bacterium]
MSKKIFVFAALISYSTFSYSQTYPSDKKADFVFPGNSWEYVKDPYAQGWDTAKLKSLKQFIIDSANTTGMMVIQQGKVIFSYGDLKELSYIASCRKSVLSILYGPFVENGKINLNSTLEQINIDDINGLLPIEKKATIRNLLTARSGVYHEPSYSGDEYAFAPKRGSVQPGSFFLYNNWDFNLAGYLFEKLSGVGIYDAVDSMLAHPLNMEDWDKNIQHKDADTIKSMYPAYPMWFSTRDMARIGYLMLRNGRWKDKQITTENWVNTITTSFTSTKEMKAFKSPYYKDGAYMRYFGYGYLWWVWDAPDSKGAYEGAYTAQGNFGQYITVLPALDVVIAHKTKAAYDRYTSNYLTILTKLIAANNSELSAKDK